MALVIAGLPLGGCTRIRHLFHRGPGSPSAAVTPRRRLRDRSATPGDPHPRPAGARGVPGRHRAPVARPQHPARRAALPPGRDQRLPRGDLPRLLPRHACGEAGMRVLVASGFDDAILIDGGIEAWIRAGYRTVLTVQGTPPAPKRAGETAQVTPTPTAGPRLPAAGKSAKNSCGPRSGAAANFPGRHWMTVQTPRSTTEVLARPQGRPGRPHPPGRRGPRRLPLRLRPHGRPPARRRRPLPLRRRGRRGRPLLPRARHPHRPARPGAHPERPGDERRAASSSTPPSMQTIHEIDADGADRRPSTAASSGATWSTATLEHGLVPRVLTNNLGVSIAGTLSMAGLGRRQLPLRHPGRQRRRARGGHRRRRDRHLLARGEPRALRRRALRPRAVRRHHPRQDPAAALQAAGCASTTCSTTTSASSWRTCKRIMHPDNPTFSTRSSRWCTPCLQGIKKIGEGMELGEGMQTFAYWLYPLHLTVEFDRRRESRTTAALLAGLAPLPPRPHRGLHASTSSATAWTRSSSSGGAAATGTWPIRGWRRRSPGTRRASSSSRRSSITPPQALGPGGHILLWPAYTAHLRRARSSCTRRGTS